MSSYAKIDVRTIFQMCNNYIDYYNQLQLEQQKFIINGGDARLTSSEKEHYRKIRSKIGDLGHEDIKEIRNAAELCYFIMNNNKISPWSEKITISDNIARILNNFYRNINKEKEEIT